MDTTWFLIYVLGSDSPPVPEPERQEPILAFLAIAGVVLILALTQKPKR